MSDKYLFTNSEYPVEVTFFEENHLEDHSPETHEYENAVRLLVINNGEVDVLCNDTIYHGKPGQAVFINVGVNHRIATSRREDTAFYNVFFDPSFVLNISDSTKLKSDYYDSLAQNPKVRCFVMDESDIFEDAAIDKINSIIVANTVRKKGYELMTKGYLCMLWVALLNYSSSTDDKKCENVYFSRDELRVSAARAFIEEKYSEYITLEDIAGRIHVSRNECCRCFQRVMFMSPVDYLITFRVFSAAKMPDQIDEATVKRRFDRLLETVSETSAEYASSLTGKTLPVLVEERDRENSDGKNYLTGRLENNLLVHFEGCDKLIGQIVNVRLTDCKGFYFMGETTE